MGKNKGKSKTETTNDGGKTKKLPTTGNDSNEPPDDVDAGVVLIPSQEHCTWLLNIIRLHAAEITSEQLKEFENNQVCDLTKQIKNLKEELSALKSASNTSNEIEYLKSENAKKQRRIERLEFENSKRQSEIRDLKIQLDEILQKDLDKFIQIVGLPETNDDNEDVKQLSKLSKDKLGVKIKSSDIVNMHRPGKKGNSAKSRNVIIKLKDKQTKENIFAQRKKLIKTGNPAGSIYLNDALTPHRQQLLFAARKLVKSKKLFAAWSQQGNILVKREETSKIIQVRQNGDLMDIKFNQLDTGDNSKGEASEMSSVMSHLSDYEYFCDSD